MAFQSKTSGDGDEPAPRRTPRRDGVDSHGRRAAPASLRSRTSTRTQKTDLAHRAPPLTSPPRAEDAVSVPVSDPVRDHVRAATEARYRALVEVAGQIVWTTSATGEVDDGGGMAGWCAYTGMRPDEVRGWDWLAAVHPDDRERVSRAWARAIAGRERYSAEYRLRRHDGVYRDFAIQGVPVLNADGSLREWVGICVDITEHKRAEAERAALLAREQTAARHLRALQAVTEAALAHRALDDLMPCLLDRLLEALEADHATILLVDDDAGTLSVRAERGIAITDTLRIRTPMGRGIAGRIAASRQPLVVDDLSAVEVVNHHVRNQLCSLVGVPLLLGDAVMGVVVVGTVAGRHFTEDDVRLLERAAERVGLALGQARQYEVERRAREEAGARAAQLAAMIESMADGVIVHDAEGRMLHTNSAARTLLGLDTTPDVAAERGAGRWTLRDALGRPLSEDRMPLFRVLRGETLTGPNAVDVTLTTHDGREVELSLSVAPVLDDARRVAGGVLIFRDVTERRQLERRTAESLRALLQMAEALVSPEGDGGAQGQRSDTSGGGPPALLDEYQDTPDTRRDAAAQVRESHDTVERLAELTRSVLGCQRVAMLSLDAAAQEVAVRAASGVVASAADARLASFALFSLVTQLTDGQLAQLRAGEPLLVELAPVCPRTPRRNAADATLHGAAPNEEIAGRSVLVAPLRLRGALVGLLVIDDADAQHTYTAQEVALAAGVAQLAALVIERERLLREHAEAQASEMALRAANKQMDDFLSMASHELRTPLTSVKAYVQVAQRRLRQPADESVSEDLAAHLARRIEAAQAPLERASAHSDVLNRLVGDLLDASRIQAHHLDMRMASCDLAELVREVVEEQQLAWPERMILLACAAHPGSCESSATGDLGATTDESPTADRSGVLRTPSGVCAPQSPSGDGVLIEGDAGRLKQVIANYLTNALKYAPDDQPITVGIAVEAESAHVYVRDRGPGLPTEEQQRIWERFHRSAGVRTQNGTESGLGLGLYICRGIVELHGGTVGLASTVGEGCTFSFTLPRLNP